MARYCLNSTEQRNKNKKIKEERMVERKEEERSEFPSYLKANCTRVAKLQTRRARHWLSSGWRTARFFLLSVSHLCTERVQSALVLQFCYSSRASNQNGQRAVTNRTHCCCQKHSQLKATPCGSQALCLECSPLCFKLHFNSGAFLSF